MVKRTWFSPCDNQINSFIFFNVTDISIHDLIPPTLFVPYHYMKNAVKLTNLIKCLSEYLKKKYKRTAVKQVRWMLD